MPPIYLDHSATTPLDPRVREAIHPYMTDIFGNASSIHSFGQAAVKGVDLARAQTAAFLGATADEIIFTSGATESNNLAIKGLVKALRAEKLEKMHVITSLVEHDAVLEPYMELEKEGAQVTHLSVKKNGAVDPAELVKALREDTVLVSIMWVNSEVGAVMPIRELGKVIGKWNESRLREWEKRSPVERGQKPRPVIFHTDATQAINFFAIDVNENKIDLLSLSAHKIYGPKGVGVLYKRDGVPMLALQRGGHHEKNYRSGTLNTPGIVGLGAALSLLTPEYRAEANERIGALRDRLVDGITKNIPDVVLNTDRPNATPAHAHFSFLGVEGEAILMALDLEHGIAVSTGSACASGSLKASHVLIAMGIRKEVAHNSIRITLGRFTTEEEIDRVIEVLPPIIERYRKMSPVYGKEAGGAVGG